MYVMEKTKDFNFFKKFDYILFSAIIILSIIGTFVVSSAVNTMPTARRMMIVHVGAILVGIIKNGMVLMNVPALSEGLVIGVLILISVMIDLIRSRGESL